MYANIGGGWAEDVVFTCEDACAPVTVEVLVMDYWCNWSVAWTDVWVEDRTPVSVVRDVVDQSITCKVYNEDRYELEGNDHPVSLSKIVDLAKEGDSSALAVMDQIFGGYEKAWIDPYGGHVDINNNPIETEIPFYDSTCRCTSDVEYFRIYDEHLGYIWKDSQVTNCYYEPDTLYFQNGIVEVNCSQNVYCEQEVWCDFDHCGEGYIYRKFKIWQGCADSFYADKDVPDSLKHPVDTIVRHQRIYVGNECELNKFMFDVPGDLTVYSCGIEYDENGSGNVVGDAGPENTGYATYKFDDGCRLVGIAHEDKVFKIVGGEEGCYKIVRTWYFADWCSDGEPADDRWWVNPEDLVGSCEQKILVIDTTAPMCMVTGPVEHGGIYEVGACDIVLNVEVAAQDECGLIGYLWQLRDDNGTVVDHGEGELDGDSLVFGIETDTILPGGYSLQVTVSDACNNESSCEYDIEIASVKKPTPVCITSLTADVIPWDSNNDGEPDSSHAIVWASEFNQSSQAPCGISDDSLSYFIEFVTGGDQDQFDEARVADSLVVTCRDQGTKMVRMWAVDPLGAADYCDVLLVVQDNNSTCEFDPGNAASVIGQIENESGAIVEKVQVMAESSQALNSIKSGEDGTFEFEAPMGARVVLTPFKNINPLNGITTNDLVVMLNHISGTTPLETAYRRLGADVNRDGSINSLDLLDLRKLILGEVDRLPASESWRFILKDYVLGENPESEDVPYQLDIDMTAATMTGDFVGVKMGDLDMDNDPENAAPRSSDALVFTTDDRLLKAGNTYSIPISATRFVDQTGYQYTLQFDSKKVRLQGFDVGSLEYLDRSNFGTKFMQEGVLTTSWNTTSEGTGAQWGQTLYTVTVTAKEDVQLSDAMAISSTVTDAESYKAGSAAGVALEFDALVRSDQVELYQNVPNPAKDYTAIEFYLPTAGDMKLIITDVTGKMMKKYEGFYGAGKHLITIEKSELPPSEVYFYSLISGGMTITKRMVFIK